MAEQTAEQSMTETEVRRRVNRRRQHLALTCHLETIAKLDQLCVRFSSTRGRVVDRLVETLYRAYTNGNLVCIHGQPCQIGRKDLPEVF